MSERPLSEVADEFMAGVHKIFTEQKVNHDQLAHVKVFYVNRIIEEYLLEPEVVADLEHALRVTRMWVSVGPREWINLAHVAKIEWEAPCF